MLHTLSVSPGMPDIAAMLRLMEHGDDLVLLSDGVTAAIADGRFLEILAIRPHNPIRAGKTTLTPAGWLVKLRTVSAGLAILISSDSQSNMPVSWPGDGGIVVYFLTPFRHRPKILRPHNI